MKIKRVIFGGLSTIMLSGSALALSTAGKLIMDVPCQIIVAIWDALRAVGPALVATFFIYGAVKYTYSADDPGGRKQGKTIMIHSIIGFILMALLAGIVAVTGITGNFCTGITI